jgi:purine-binding chemotaxis protein CheW
MSQTAAAANAAVKSARGQPVPISQEVQVVTFELFAEIFALPILDVREIIRMVPITPVPQAPAFVEGVINLRGQILPVVDLRRRFGLTPQNRDDNTCIIVVELGNNTVIGLIVDAVREVERLPSSTITPPPSLVAGAIGAEYIKGISNFGDKMMIHIDLRKVFTPSEMNALEAAAA